MAGYEVVDEGHDFPWLNKVWRSPSFRRAHLDVVDVRESKKLFMVHLCVFPNADDPSPIFGFDLIAGPTKVTGAFHDFSPTSGTSPLDVWFKDEVGRFTPSKERSLPDWAKAIFSDSMIAAGNVSDLQELSSIIEMVKSNLDHYVRCVGQSNNGWWLPEQNKYCFNQKRNPHTPRVMESLGFEKEVVHEFIETCLFPELKETP